MSIMDDCLENYKYKWFEKKIQIILGLVYKIYKLK
jgi:hypothetical protein